IRALRQCPAPGLATGRLDLDDVGAEPGEHLGAARSRLVLRQVQHHDPFERLPHVPSVVAGPARPPHSGRGLSEARPGSVPPVASHSTALAGPRGRPTQGVAWARHGPAPNRRSPLPPPLSRARNAAPLRGGPRRDTTPVRTASRHATI